jgi:two-component system cell cycle response regulator CtrA
MRILLVEDDDTVAQSVELMLKFEGFGVYLTSLGEEAVEIAKFYDYDAIVLDLDLPDMPGLEVLRHLRAGRINTPVVVLSGSSDMDLKIRALGAGADDFMVKPAHKNELVARLRAVVRRSKGHSRSVIQTGELSVDLDSKTAEINGERVPLSSKEYQVLELLSLRKGVTLTKEVFLNHLYDGLDEEPEPKIIDVFVCKLRKKLAAASNGGNPIETVWGKGYLLRDEDKRPLAQAA